MVLTQFILTQSIQKFETNLQKINQSENDATLVHCGQSHQKKSFQILPPK
jgi:hypothetical protein